MSDTQNYYCIILAGGVGSRLWPYSREHKPKQFLDLFGTGSSMLQITYSRFLKFLPKENIFISTYEDYADLVHEHLPDVADSRIISEPVQLSTTPAIALTAAAIATINPEANIIISPTDQMIVNNDVFGEQVLHGFSFIEHSPNFLVLGVKATLPETTYGYIQAGENMVDGFACVKSFTEKPALDFARFFVESGEFYWSTSLFLCNVNTLFQALCGEDPYIGQFYDSLKNKVDRDELFDILRNHYPRNRYQSIDMLILEHNKNVYIEPCTFGWRDMGSWHDYYQLSLKDANGNVVNNSKCTLYNCHDNIVMVPDDKIVLLQDLKDYLLIEKDNIIMVCKKDDTAQIRRMMTDSEVKYGGSIS